MQRYHDAHRLELSAFVDAIASATDPQPGGADGLRALELADAAVLSSVEAGAVAV